ncbi:hypothetical protein H6G89_10540 [Oscillatoria sp. FACHB-1407]|uniref:hypothetical protein n=1 Tax=Oscillatoria sp. FACHB-1407 TaxID=2692847 RepID=UPI0016857206|nr:hypothetical protein [Oscillatoria sp. FACHB-1407]MBD2461486.1 hypothetical protein [Oscillatoria sp. FACHB-1407]
MAGLTPEFKRLLQDYQKSLKDLRDALEEIPQADNAKKLLDSIISRLNSDIDR